MVRTQIQLTEEQAENARRRARQMGVSMAEFIRRALDQALASAGNEAAVRKRSLRAIGCAASGTGDMSVNHDKYLEEAYSK